ncbi:hypothetical protein, partial [Candidatus Enterovibrio escicola]
ILTPYGSSPYIPARIGRGFTAILLKVWRNRATQHKPDSAEYKFGEKFLLRIRFFYLDFICAT